MADPGSATSRPRNLKKANTEKSSDDQRGSSAFPTLPATPPSGQAPQPPQTTQMSPTDSPTTPRSQISSKSDVPASPRSPANARGSIGLDSALSPRGSVTSKVSSKNLLRGSDSSIIQASHSERHSRLMGSGTSNKVGFWGSLFGSGAIRSIDDINESNIDQHLEAVMEELKFSQSGKDLMFSEPYKAKLDVIKNFMAEKKDHDQPLEYITSLRKKPNETVELLVFSLKSESPIWIRTFVKHGGLELMMQILILNAKKLQPGGDASKKKEKEKEKEKDAKAHVIVIQNIILSVKGLLQHDDGVDAMIAKPEYTVLLIQVLHLLDQRIQIVALHLIAGISSLDQGLYMSLLPIVEKKCSVLISLCSSANPEVAAATLTFLNTLVFAPPHDGLPAQQINRLKNLFLNQGLGTIAQEWRSRKSLAESMQAQLGVLELNIDLELSAYNGAVAKTGESNNNSDESSIAETPQRLIEKIITKVKGTAINDSLVNILVNLLRLNSNGIIGFNKWDLVNQFVRGMELVDDSIAVHRDKALAACLENVKLLEKSTKSGTGTGAAQAAANKANNKPSQWQTAARKGSGVRRSNWTDRLGSAAGKQEELNELLKIEAESDAEVKQMTEGIKDQPKSPEGGAVPGAPGTGDNSSGTAGFVPPSEPPPPPPAPGAPDAGGAPPPPPPPGAPPPPPPPPPPGGPGGANVPKKEQSIVPTTKVRPLYWNKVNFHKLKGTLWEEMKADIKLPANILEEEYCYVSSKQKAPDLTSSETKTLILLDSKRWQNISIMLSRFNTRDMSFKNVFDAVMAMDDKVLTTEDIQALASFTPTDQELELLAPYAGAVPENMGEPERFFLLISKIPNLKVRLDCWVSKLTFATQFVDVKGSVETLLRACVEVKKSTNLKKVLEIILAFGNFLNHGTQRGGAFGFRLDGLLQLADVRSQSDPKTTLLHTIIEYLQATYPDTVSFYQELSNSEGASQLKEMGFLTGELKALKDAIAQIQEFMLKPGAKAGKFETVMKDFLPTSSALVSKIETLFQKAQGLYGDLVNFFGENEGTTQKSFGEFFGTLFAFCVVFEKTVEDIKHRKELEEKQRIAQIEKERREAERRAMKEQNQQQGKATRLKQVMDDLSSGQAYTGGKRRIET